MKIDDVNYSIEIFRDMNKIIFCGNFRLNSVDKYNEIMDMAYNMSKESMQTLTFDVTKLEFINSSGIASMGIFFVKIRDLEKKIKIIASKYVKWHVTTLSDFQKINSNIDIEYIAHH